MVLGACLVSVGAFGALIDPGRPGRIFDGIGGVSGGGGCTRLLYDYPESTRNDILDLLFKPNFGASLHMLKVEIGCDGDTTQGAEQSHMHTEDDYSATAFDRGYETWFMTEAKKRNKDVVLAGLEWGVPGWVADEASGMFTERNVNYIVAWLRGMREKKGLNISSIGVGYNEHPFNATWIKMVRRALDYGGFADVRTVASDQCCGAEWSIADAMAKDEELRDAVDVIGAHCPTQVNGRKAVPEKALSLGKPLWDSEQHFGLPDPSDTPCWEWKAAADLARTYNQVYLLGNITSVQMWTPVYSWYNWLPYAGKGLFVANTPWSGNYAVSRTLWVTAHTTQFTRPGWRYASGDACRLLTVNGSTTGSVVTYLSPSGGDVSVVIETMTASGTGAGVGDQTLSFTLAGRLEASVLVLWATNETEQFVAAGAVPIVNGTVTVTVPPNTLYTLSTLAGPSKGVTYVPPASPFATMLPFNEDFSSYGVDRLPRFVSDLNGAFSVDTEAPGSENKVLRQRATSAPRSTHGHSGDIFAAGVGDSSWDSYVVSVRARTEAPSGTPLNQQMILVGSHGGAGSRKPEDVHRSMKSPGYMFVATMDGAWRLTAGNEKKVVASGTGTWSPGDWLNITLSATITNSGVAVRLTLDRAVLANASLSVGASIAGPVFIGCGRHQAAFDDLAVVSQYNPEP
eukprot:TRINITY_DN1004_c2_g6_i1.p1 TRINITY_DN1004_c2_g6~~TRINITY_DN1004_c2_g6_i1.p1  ORF type:complete len:683 (+),score=164.62 TRINITY_DN1004_c2_g6_i1:319-2367(+)